MGKHHASSWPRPRGRELEGFIEKGRASIGQKAFLGQGRGSYVSLLQQVDVAFTGEVTRRLIGRVTFPFRRSTAFYLKVSAGSLKPHLSFAHRCRIACHVFEVVGEGQVLWMHKRSAFVSLMVAIPDRVVGR